MSTGLTFAKASFCQIVRMLLKAHRVIYTHWSLSHGLELFTGDGYRRCESHAAV